MTSPARPHRLPEGGTIGIAAPAGPFDQDAFERGRMVLESMGFQVHVPSRIHAAASGYLAGSDALRADVLNGLFGDPDIDAVICARGGYGSLRVLPLLDYELIREKRKILVGFSDITAILSALNTHAGLISFHGPMVTTLGNAGSRTIEALMAALVSGNPVEPALHQGRTIRSGRCSGPVSGGNLCMLCHLAGTAYAPILDGHILVLEDTNEPEYKIDRMLTHLRLAGLLDGVAGVVLGSFNNCGAMDRIGAIVEDVFPDKSIPILAGLEIGHDGENLTLPMGLEATMDADRHTLTFHGAATEAQ